MWIAVSLKDWRDTAHCRKSIYSVQVAMLQTKAMYILTYFQCVTDEKRILKMSLFSRQWPLKKKKRKKVGHIFSLSFIQTPLTQWSIFSNISCGLLPSEKGGFRSGGYEIVNGLVPSLTSPCLREWLAVGSEEVVCLSATQLIGPINPTILLLAQLLCQPRVTPRVPTSESIKMLGVEGTKGNGSVKRRSGKK